MNKLYTTALRAAGTFVLVIQMFFSAALLAQPTEGNTVIAIEDIVFTQSTTTSSPAEINNKNLAKSKSVENSSDIQYDAWEIPSYEQNQVVSINVTAYPNPVVDQLWIETEDAENELQMIELYSANGQLLTQQNTPAMQAQIDMSSLPSGSYYLRTTTLKGVTTLPVSK